MWLVLTGRHAQHLCLLTESSIRTERGRGQGQQPLHQHNFSSFKHLLSFFKKKISLFIYVYYDGLPVSVYKHHMPAIAYRGQKWVLGSLSVDAGNNAQVLAGAASVL